MLDNNSFKVSSRGIFFNLLIVTVVYGTQEVFRVYLFRCPCDHFTLYGLAMISAPTIFLLGLGFMASDVYWHAVITRRSMRSYKQRCNYCLKAMTRLFQPFLAPAVFLVSVLLQGDYYVCARIGAQGAACQEAKHNGRYPVESQTPLYDVARLYSQSQFLGCGLLAGASIFATGMVAIRRLCFSSSLPDDEEYRRCEEEALQAAFRQQLQAAVKREALRTVEEAFGNADGRSALTTYHQAWDHVTNMRQQSTLGRFARLAHADDDLTAVRIVDSTL